MIAECRRCSRGTSILEILISTGVLLTLLAIGLPQLSTVRAPYILVGSARQISAAVQAARQRAIARNVRYRVSFISSPPAYSVERDNGGTWVAELPLQLLPSGATLGTVTPGNPVFDTRGMLAADVTVPITVAGAGTKTVTVNVLGKTAIN
jgi:Tfp pilus assembly protein FimT